MNETHEQKAGAVMRLCDVIRETAYAIHVYHGHGHLEKVYENALVHRLRTQGLQVEEQHPVKVRDEDGTVIGGYFADLFVEGCLIVDLKACRALADEHVAQLLGYLRSCRIEHGLLLNFGAPRFEVREFVLSDALRENSSFAPSRGHSQSLFIP